LRPWSNVINFEVLLDDDLGHVGCLLYFFQTFLVDLGRSARFGLFLSRSLALLFFARGLGSCEHFGLSPLLRFDQLALVALGLRLLLLGLLFLFRTGFFLPVRFLLVVLGAREPVDEVFEEGTHGALCGSVVEFGVAIQAEGFGLPLDEELVLEHAVVVELLAKGGRELLLLWEAVDEELDDGLQQVLGAVLCVLRDQTREHLLISVPRLDNVAVGAAEDAAHGQV